MFSTIYLVADTGNTRASSSILVHCLLLGTNRWKRLKALQTWRYLIVSPANSEGFRWLNSDTVVRSTTHAVLLVTRDMVYPLSFAFESFQDQWTSQGERLVPLALVPEDTKAQSRAN